MEKLQYEEIEGGHYVTDGSESIEINLILINRILQQRNELLTERLLKLLKDEPLPINLERVKEVLNEQ
jgi:hypothetical protein